jgi:hypothetical protein
MTITELKQTAVEVRKGIVTATHAAKSGHPGGSLSATEIFTYLYFEEMNIDPKNPKMEDRDAMSPNPSPENIRGLPAQNKVPAPYVLSIRQSGLDQTIEILEEFLRRTEC